MTPKTHKSPESVVKEIKHRIRRKFSFEEKIRIILEALKGKDSISAICRREGIAPSLYYKWSKVFLQACKRRDSKGTHSVRRTATRWVNCLPIILLP